MPAQARVIGVIDLSTGLAVHAQGGARAHYGPVQSLSGRRITPGDADAIARWYIDTLGLKELYVADLDALRGRTPQHAVVRRLAAMGVPLWLDAAVSTVDSARVAIDDGAATVVVGLETLSSFDALKAVCDAVGGERVAFSLDLRRGKPLTTPAAPHAGRTPEECVAAAVDAGVASVIVLDIARVGTRRGLDVDLLARIHRVSPAVPLIVGGGVRGVSDLEAAARVGCNAALVATALYDGRLLAGDLR